jgi:hypothetical protein
MITLISIYFGGVLTIFMAIFHTQFYKLFKWDAEYRNITAINKKIFYTIHLALLLLFFGLGFLTLIYAQELSRCEGISLGINVLISIFWLWRTTWQVTYFKGKIMHYLLIVYFFLLFIAYLIPVALKIIW